MMGISVDLHCAWVTSATPSVFEGDCATAACIIPLVLDASASLDEQASRAQQSLQSLDVALFRKMGAVLAGALRRGDVGLDDAASATTLKMYLSTAKTTTNPAALWLIISLAQDSSPKALHKAMIAALALLPSKGVSVCDIYLPNHGDDDTPAQKSAPANSWTWAQRFSAVLRAVEAQSYVYTQTKPDAQPHGVSAWRIHSPAADVAAKQGYQRALALARGLRLARELGNRPPNSATPTFLAEVAQDLAKNSSYAQCHVLDRAAIVAAGMGALAAVAQGSQEEPRFIVLDYQGPGVRTDTAPTILIGKGITFDSGGISLKPGAAMDYMKYDMCGAASVLGTMAAILELAPPQRVVALIPSCENLPSGSALKPGDVVTSHSGQTVEILNTDAEGRLILCDALSYAKRYQPQAVIDIATLTGACMIALGGVRAGLFANQDALAQQLMSAAEESYDLCWPMPLDDEYATDLKSKFADVANIAGRAGGSITAAKFLQRFAQGYPWAHLDIAGVAWKEGKNKGSTARPVSLLVHYLLDKAGAA